MSYSIISVDEKKCVNCRMCEIVCSLSREGKVNPHLSRIKVYSFSSHTDVPVVCRQCADAPCKEACDYDAISRRSDNAVVVSSERCTGCGLCVDACPFGAVFLHPQTNLALMCDLCAGEPVCVKYCPVSCLNFIPWEKSIEAKEGSEKALYEKFAIKE
ncbi:4Fe-4S dicluster domain-containing protein [Candidatus Aerophobetes bacterium]|nr:4Fe-4S dicluster domain-containing protein [Candidatus Aerophobetes bacterium]